MIEKVNSLITIDFYYIIIVYETVSFQDFI